MSNKILRIILFAIMLCGQALASLAQTIRVNAPQQVAVGEQFRLQYIVNTTDVKGFRAGNIPGDAFEVLMGPSTSTQQSFQIINGHTTSSASVTYTYILCATKNGSFTIGGAHAKVDGKDATSPSIKITVSGKAQQPQQQGSSRQQQQRGAQVRPQGSHISGNDLFIKVSANKQRVHEQEPILLTYKVYTQVELTQLEGKMPDLKGFHTQEIPLPQQKSFHIENLNGRPYRCVTWSQYVMYPQMTGKLEIPSITFKGIVVQENTNVDPFEAFFNGGSGYVEVKKDIVAPSLTIQVDPLPERPANFSGGVGTFGISASLDKASVKAGDPVNLRITINGTGNLKLVKQPEVTLPNDFDKYEPKVTDKTQLTAEGLTGSMTYETLIVPRHVGKYEIPALQLVYFDTKTSTYKTATTQPLTLNVEKGNGKSNTVADYSKTDDNDIHAIHESGDDLSAPSELFFGSTSYVVLNTLIVIIFLVLLVMFRQRAIERANVAGMRGKKANSVAGKRLKKAAKFMKTGKTSEFYDEVLRATWGYVADKFAMPVADLSRDNITEKLTSRDVDATVIQKLIDAIDECEFERYAPGDSAGNMQRTYDTAVTAITSIENAMKKAKKAPVRQAFTDNYLHILLLAITMTFALGANAAPEKESAKSPASASTRATACRDSANIAYAKGNYQDAIILYNKVLADSCADADVYYNLGNAYYRSSNITQAVIAYEKAYRLNPGDADIKHNLKIARAKTIDALQPTDRMILAEWFDAVRNINSIDGWSHTALWSLVLALLLFLVYLFIPVGESIITALLQRLAFYASVVFIVITVMANIFAYSLNNMPEIRIVTSPEATIKKTPDTQAADAYLIHEGTRLEILDTSLDGWYEVLLPDGRQGWILSSKCSK